MEKRSKNRYRDTRISKRMAYLLRHGALKEGIEIDEHGWMPVESLLDWLSKKGDGPVSIAEVERIVQMDEKHRYSLKAGKIRANQGHTIEVDLDLQPRKPPDTLFHGTAKRFVKSIIETGIQRQGRHHVHLSPTPETALTVGARHGKPVVLAVDAKRMYDEGFEFFKSENNVWLVDHVPPRFISNATNLQDAV